MTFRASHPLTAAPPSPVDSGRIGAQYPVHLRPLPQGQGLSMRNFSATLLLYACTVFNLIAAAPASGMSFVVEGSRPAASYCGGPHLANLVLSLYTTVIVYHWLWALGLAALTGFFGAVVLRHLEKQPGKIRYDVDEADMPFSNADLEQRQKRLAWIWLAYTGFLLVQPLVAPSLYLWLGTIAVLAVFFGMFLGYFSSTATGYPVRFWRIGMTFFLGLITFPWNHGATTFFIYTAALFPFVMKSVRKVVGLIVLECLIILAEGAVCTIWVHQPVFQIGWSSTFVSIFFVMVVGCGNIYVAEHNRYEARLRGVLEENVELAAAVERERIARDLHDVLGHTLSVITLKSELAGRMVAIDSSRTVSELAEVEKISRAALTEIRKAISGYRAQGLAAEIEASSRVLHDAGVTLLAEEIPASMSFTPQEETALSLVLREAVTNIVRHAQASTCRLSFVCQPILRRLVVEDDGQHQLIREGNGIRGIRERVASLDGQFRIESGAEQRGTRLVIDLPPYEDKAE
jgi:two-component system sensor histidine kinase DesK